MQIKPITFKDANEFVRRFHRHHKPVVGCKFCVAVENEEGLQGVAIVGRPADRMLDDGFTLEVNRLCTNGAYNACSMLYSAAARVARELGYHRILTYILSSEPGTSLKASGWKFSSRVRGSEWSVPSRPRKLQGGAQLEDKTRWEMQLRHGAKGGGAIIAQQAQAQFAGPEQIENGISGPALPNGPQE